MLMDLHAHWIAMHCGFYDLRDMQSDRVYYGPDAADSTPGRMFVLFGEILQCVVHRPLWWYGEKRIKHWQNERQTCFDGIFLPLNRTNFRWNKAPLNSLGCTPLKTKMTLDNHHF